jgi:hypothetical protein
MVILKLVNKSLHLLRISNSAGRQVDKAYRGRINLDYLLESITDISLLGSYSNSTNSRDIRIDSSGGCRQSKKCLVAIFNRPQR